MFSICFLFLSLQLNIMYFIYCRDYNLTIKLLFNILKMRKLLFTLALATSATLASAQGAVANETDIVTNPNKYQVVTNRFFDNWFVSVGAGGQVFMGKDDAAGKFGSRIAPSLNVSLGKWFTPALGLRVQYSGLQAKGYTYNSTAPYISGGLIDGSYYKQKMNYMNLHGDIMVNLSALFGGYNPERVYEIIPFLGAGVAHSFDSPKRNSITLNGGIQNRFRVSRALDINLDINAMGVQGKFDGETRGKYNMDCMLGVTAGVTYRFKTRTFGRPATQLISAADLATLRQSMNDMSAENAALQEEVAQLKSRPTTVTEVVLVEGSIAPRPVFFEINSAKISPREAMNIKLLAETIKEDGESNFVVYGYADANTGSAAYNQALSLKRAQAVVDALVNDHGVSSNRVKASADGGVDTFGKPVYLNRVAVIKSAK